MRLLWLLLLSLPLVACTPRGYSGGGGDDDDAVGDDDDATEAPPAEYGPQNEWWHALEEDVPADLAGTGSGVGDVAANFTITDQNGDDVELYQFYGKIIVVDVFAEWCPPCRDNAPHGQELWDDADGEVILLAAMQENQDASPANAEGIARWVEDFSLTHPVLADGEKLNLHYAGSGFPTYVVIDRDMTILNADLWPFDTSWVLGLVE